MKLKTSLLTAFICASVIACNSVQKSVDPTGQNPIPRGTERNIDEDTIKAPGSDTSGLGLPDSVRREK
ncbi:hypothetical protein [Pararcticibacter amylolyticus]|uniref:Lipoprotein n=1 Tax=Pararcticibacter amylolyticus TaxID=2173175 RepID=A0A2U2PLN3_9SPHI|nr:hypothetical protein [Pararcticibacter amylolyticus]PWG82317.1 hypothetical protein DDR33_00115 [Pararcticibacter amylolyticus]